MIPKVNALKILIADDHPVVREGLAAVINRRPDMTVVAEATTGRQAVEQFLALRPDVALLDLRMPELDGIAAIATIRAEVPTARIVVLTTYDDTEDVRRAFQAGAKAYLLKDTPRNQLVDTIHAVYQGRTIVLPALAEKLADILSASELTAREIEVLRLITDGATNKEIANALFVAEGTVKTHVAAILRKLNAADRTQAVTIALKRGLLRLT